LLRCWAAVERDSLEALDERFVVESVSEAPHHWAFSTFEELVDFLRAELLRCARTACVSRHPNGCRQEKG